MEAVLESRIASMQAAWAFSMCLFSCCARCGLGTASLCSVCFIVLALCLPR